ncbi:uncharacterized protein BJ171DRAFT_640222 [Polychytrium aggregatum]|uniref:uncharacterized protein n=1 Tax=Polychytrium aggregatum TaxID=110093 RepID=UPI0022FEFCD2|nr:uncharacterized protein BJ171DRAFT_640222 [Polychytrium aggregatum]KAI9207353.1 hypothetical protein BJ171DRAFT_640222 [Polychytrium aggregatum]
MLVAPAGSLRLPTCALAAKHILYRVVPEIAGECPLCSGIGGLKPAELPLASVEEAVRLCPVFVGDRFDFVGLGSMVLNTPGRSPVATIDGHTETMDIAALAGDLDACAEVARIVARDKAADNAVMDQVTELLQWAAPSIIEMFSGEMNVELCWTITCVRSTTNPTVDSVWTDAAKYFQAVSEARSVEANFYLGWMHLLGLGVQKKDIDALHYWDEVSLKSTDPVLKSIVTHMLGWMY